VLSDLPRIAKVTGMVKVLVIMDRKKTILSEGLLSMLGYLDNTQITAAFPRKNGDLQRKIKSYQPDVVIFFDNRFSESQLEMTRILFNENKEMRVLIVRKEENSFFSIEKKRIAITNTSDFFDSLHSESSQLITDCRVQH
jgi:hypothetical protein